MKGQGTEDEDAGNIIPDEEDQEVDIVVEEEEETTTTTEATATGIAIGSKIGIEMMIAEVQPEGVEVDLGVRRHLVPDLGPGLEEGMILSHTALRDARP